MLFTKDYWSSSAKKLKDVKYLALIALFIAMKTVLSGIRIPVSENLHISITYILIAIESSIIGPVAGLVSGFVSDLVGFAVFPSGTFFPGYTLTAMAGIFVYALFLYRTRITVLKIIGAKLINNYLINVAMGSLWSSMLYGNAYLYYAAKSLVKNTLLLPIEVIILTVVFNVLVPVLVHRKLIPDTNKTPLKIK